MSLIYQIVSQNFEGNAPNVSIPKSPERKKTRRGGRRGLDKLN
jgi:hypothetical protein